MSDPPPIVHERVVACHATEAFAAYVDIGTWWPPTYTANADTLETVVLDPYVGGRIGAVHTDLGRHDWGEVTAWDPGHRVAHSFTLAQDPEQPSHVEVTFDDREHGGCRVRHVHGGWTAATAEVRARFGDWPTLLDRAFAAFEPDPPPR
jgi:hypothetical protein